MRKGWARALWLAANLAVVLGVSACASSCASSGASSGSSSPPPALRCATDADCRLFSDYCDGCACRALDRAAADPVCKGTQVQCLVDPCQRKQAVCAAGACTLSP